MKTFFAAAALIAASLAVSACASVFGDNALSRYDGAQAFYNTTLAELIELRERCVATAAHPDYGAAHPQCVISDAAYPKIEAVRATANACLEDAHEALMAQSPDFDVYLGCAQSSAAALARYLLE